LSKSLAGGEFTILAVNTWNEDAGVVKRFAGQNGWTFPVLLNGGDVAQQWGIRSLPTNFLIAPDGSIVAKYATITDKDLQAIEKRARDLSRG
jgi:thiol-disulfide isomerase/thioredoxin